MLEFPLDEPVASVAAGLVFAEDVSPALPHVLD